MRLMQILEDIHFGERSSTGRAKQLPVGQSSECQLLAVRPEGPNYQWRKNRPGELSIDPVADERLVWVNVLFLSDRIRFSSRSKVSQASKTLSITAVTAAYGLIASPSRM